MIKDYSIGNVPAFVFFLVVTILDSSLLFCSNSFFSLCSVPIILMNFDFRDVLDSYFII